jgi:protein-disulfide isomerase
MEFCVFQGRKEFARFMMKIERLLTKVGAICLLAGLVSLLTVGRGSPAQASDHEATRDKIIRYVRERYNIPDAVKVSVGEFRDSSFADFYETTLTLDDGKQKRSQEFFVSKDGRYLVEGNIFTLGADPRKEVVRSISLQEQATQGPAGAPVTIVEYSDLQCPVCAHFHEFLEKEVIPKYGEKVRLVFKEFPLTSIHDWALSGAIAAECTYQIDPSKFVPFRSLVFQNQSSLNAGNSRDMLLHLAAEAGVDNMKLASCIDSQASLPRVEASLSEGQGLGIASTPTCFVNGQVVVGAPEPAKFFHIVDEALQAAK